MAQEERFNDVYVMRKLSSTQILALTIDGTWPAEFDHYESLLKIGAAAGHRACYADYTELMPIVLDLLRDRPSMTADELAELVNVFAPEAADLLSKARA